MTDKKKNVATLFKYQISGYYFADDERKHFEDYIMATDEVEAMQIAIGIHSWKTSLDGKAFRLDVIHYELW